MTADDARRLVAELLGTAALLSAVVGSGIVVDTGGSEPATQLFQHAIVVGVTLTALILTFGPVSGAHFNPVVTAVDWWFGGLPARRAIAYVVVQVVGAVLGVLATDAMFGAAVGTLATTARDGLGVVGGEVVATAGLILVIFALARSDRLAAVPGAVGAWIAAAIVFTSSASFANPAVTLARALTDTWTGIALASVPGFLAGQAVGAVLAAALVRWLYHPSPDDAAEVLVPHQQHPQPEHTTPTGAH